MYKLTQREDYVIRLLDNPPHPDVEGEHINIRSNSYWANEYKKWVLAGNTPLPADPVYKPEDLTVEEKLQRSGLSLEELRSALGL